MALMHKCMRVFSWDDARYFLAVHRAGSLTAAGRRLGANQSTVGRRLAALESSLGARLFERRPTGFTLTPAGAALLVRAERMEDEALSAERELLGREARLEGTLRLTTPEALGTRFLSRRLPVFLERHPGLELQLLTDNRALSLTRHEADVALRLMRPQQAGLFSRKLAEVGSGLFASRRYLSQHRGLGLTGAGFEGHRLVGFAEGFQPEAEVRWLERHASGARTVLRCTSPQTQAEAAAAGVGLALIPSYLAREFPTLVQVLGPAEVLTRGLWLVLHPDLRRNARVRALVAFLDEAFTAERPLLSGVE